MTDPLPDRPSPGMALDRQAIERVLARAAELNVGGLEASEGMSEAQLVALGAEVGISAAHVRQALAEERTRVDVREERGFIGSLFGGTVAVASRIVPGQPAAVLAEIDQWMQREEMLTPKRRFSDRLTWEARRDFIGSLQVGLNLSGRPYALSRATEVGATVSALDGSRVLVALEASFSDARRGAVTGAAVVSGIGVAGAAGVVALATFIPGGSTLVGGLIGGGWAAAAAGIAAVIGRHQRGRLHRLQLGLEQVLDRLEHGDARRSGSAFTDLLSAITR